MAGWSALSGLSPWLRSDAGLLSRPSPGTSKSSPALGVIWSAVECPTFPGLGVDGPNWSSASAAHIRLLQRLRSKGVRSSMLTASRASKARTRLWSNGFTREGRRLRAVIVVLAAASSSTTRLAPQLRDMIPEVHLVGVSSHPACHMHATNDGASRARAMDDLTYHADEVGRDAGDVCRSDRAGCQQPEHRSSKSLATRDPQIGANSLAAISCDGNDLALSGAWQTSSEPIEL
jgi:hypothetical protein